LCGNKQEVKIGESVDDRSDEGNTEVEGSTVGYITSKKLQHDKYEWGNGKKRARKTNRTDERDRMGETDGERMMKGEGSEISTGTLRERHPLGLSVGP